jgi:hypothetical protein
VVDEEVETQQQQVVQDELEVVEQVQVELILQQQVVLIDSVEVVDEFVTLQIQEVKYQVNDEIESLLYLTLQTDQTEYLQVQQVEPLQRVVDKQSIRSLVLEHSLWYLVQTLISLCSFNEISRNLRNNSL